MRTKGFIMLFCCSMGLINGRLGVAQTLPTTQQQNFSQSPSLIQENKEGLWLVEARCFSVDAATNTAQWRVTILFNGPQNLLNSTFPSSLIQPHFAGTPLPFTPTIGDDVIWTVQFIDGKLERGAITSIYNQDQSRLAYGVKFPIGRNHPLPSGTAPAIYSNFDRALFHAQTIKRVAGLPPEEQVKVLTSYTRNSHYELSAWAISTLATNNSPKVLRLLQDLANDAQVSIQGQIAADSSLLSSNVAGETWAQSQKRLDFLKRLVTSQANKEDADAINSYLSDVARRESLSQSIASENKKAYKSSVDGEQLFNLLRLASNN